MMTKKFKKYMIVFIFLSFFLFVCLSPSRVLGDDTGFSNGGTASNIEVGNPDFSNVNNALTQSNSYASCNIASKGLSDYLRITNFGFDLEDGSTITGIEVQVDDYGQLGIIDCENIYLVLSDATTGNDLETGTNIGDTDTDTYRSYGGASNMWGTSLGESDIEDSTFGVQLQYYNDHNTQARSVYVDHIKIKIYYTPPADTNAPTWDSLLENSDPIELGENVSISINVYDEGVISFVYLEFGGVNHTMNSMGGDNYNFSNWIPSTTGLHNYTIWMSDDSANINSTMSNITVIDTTNPLISNVIESADPLELSDTEIITCNITDLNTLDKIYLEFEGSNHTMINVGGTAYRYDSWTPAIEGIYHYNIHVNDSAGNYANHSGYITVQDLDNEPPTWDTLLESDDFITLGENVSISINVYDESVISFVYLEFGGVNHTMNSMGGDNYNYSVWTPLSAGVHVYTIWMIDEFGNINNTSGTITVLGGGVPEGEEDEGEIAMILINIMSLLFLIMLNLFVHSKLEMYENIVLTTLFSFILCSISISITPSIPISPFIQIVVILIQFTILIWDSVESYMENKNKKKRTRW